MNRFLIPLFVIFILTGTPQLTTATLIDVSTTTANVIFDTETNQYWYQNLFDFRSRTWAEQEIAVSNLNVISYFGLTDWHVPDQTEVQGLFNNGFGAVSSSFYMMPAEDPNDWLWMARYDEFDWIIPPYSDPVIEEPGVGGHYFTYVGLNSLGIELFELSSFLIDDDMVDRDLSVWATSIGPTIDLDPDPDENLPVPEPSTILLLGSGLAGLAWYGRKRKKM